MAQDRLDALADVEDDRRAARPGSTVPVMSSPSRLGELVEDLVALDLADALEDDLLGRLGADPAELLAVEHLELDDVAGLGVGLGLAQDAEPEQQQQNNVLVEMTGRPDLGLGADLGVFASRIVRRNRATGSSAAGRSRRSRRSSP